MKIAIIGANGQLGTDLSSVFHQHDHIVVELNHDQVDISQMDSLRAIFADQAFDVVINTAAMHNVEACEADPAQSFAVNSIGARNLALLSNEFGFKLVHISTDYVFDGQKREPYLETDLPLPLNVYGNTKLAGEYFIQSIADRYFVVRVSGLYGKHPCRAKGGRNFVQLMLKLAAERDEVRVVDDEVLSPTYTLDIAHQLRVLIPTDHYGVYHATSQGECSWYAFAKEIFEYTDARVKLSIADPGEFPAKVNRPKYSVLENQQLKAVGLDKMPHWKDALHRYLDDN